MKVNVVPEGIPFVSNRTPLHRTRPKVGSREAGKDLCATRRFHTRRPTHETRPLATASPRASNSRFAKCASTFRKTRLVDTGRKSRELLTSLDRSPSPTSSRASFLGLPDMPPPKSELTRTQPAPSEERTCRALPCPTQWSLSGVPPAHTCLCSQFQRGHTVHPSLTYEPASRSKGGGQASQLHQSSVARDRRSNTSKT